MANILIGPLKRDPDYKDIALSYEILGDYAASPEILTFGELDLLKDENELNTGFNEITDNLPLNWKQDIVIFWGFDKTIIPDGLEKLDGPVIGVVFNWQHSFEAIQKNASRFDWIFADKQGEKTLKAAGINNVSGIQIRGFSQNLHRKLEDTDKEYDITFIGDLNQDLHHERTKWLYRLGKLAGKYNIKVASEVYGEDYVELINKSKIVLNFSSSGAANLRSYEVPACGTLLFEHESNEELKEFFKDKEHCIYYNENNFEELLAYYLTNDEERIKIAEQGYNQIQDYSFENMFSKLIAKTEEMDFPKLRENRTFTALPEVEQHKAKAKQALQSFVPGKFYFVEKELQAAYRLDATEPEVLNNLGVVYANAYLALTNKEDKRAYNLAKLNLSNAISYESLYALARFNLGALYFLNRDYEKAEELLSAFIMNISTDPQEALKHKGFYYTSYNLSYHDDIKLEWERITYDSEMDQEDKNFGYCDLLLYKAFEMLGDIAHSNKAFDSAEEMYSNALSVRDDIGYVKYKLGEIKEHLGKYEEALDYYRQMFADKPFHNENWLKILDVLNKLDRLEEYENFSMELLTVTKVSTSYSTYKKLINRKLAQII